jgi:hypothetical protein
MSYGGDIRNGMDPHTQRLYSADGGFTTGTRSFDEKVNFLYSHRCGGFDRLFGCQTGSERCALAGTFEAGRTCATPAYRITLLISNGHNGVVEGRIDVNLP